ncbi:hypothetical protein EXIGLDRAFT_822454 [Exidia glandulosa HHB12029]|uniref:Uncharacterized protein n=1 Tax=Exidia glandulosa HHB12029 TaxID=1314781 RepID=A0A166N7G9_EXIGL|nr:hypothetical protein EXIGLDRAFT_822454 [Exidia glandulosa HHB12029]
MHEGAGFQDWPIPGSDELLALGEFILLSINPVASVAHLDDAIATEEASRLERAIYLAIVMAIVETGLEVGESYKLGLHLYLVGQGLPKDAPLACAPIAYATVQPDARAPLDVNTALPWDDLMRLASMRLSADKDRIRFLVLFIQLGLHGSSAVKVFLILLGNYIVGRSLHTICALPMATWAFNLAILFASELNDGYRFAALHPSLAPLDALKGAYPRWHVTSNFTMLRLVSFNMDWYWAAHRVGLLHVGAQSRTGAELDEKQRPPTFHELPAYESFADYMAYIVYPPCYIAGPIMTFNEFLWQMKRPVRIAPRDVASYALRFVICLLTMEVVLHYMYVVAIKDARAWAGDTPAQLCMLGFWNLIVVWLKSQIAVPRQLPEVWLVNGHPVAHPPSGPGREARADPRR